MRRWVKLTAARKTRSSIGTKRVRGGLREERAGVVRKRQPIRLVEEAVRGMLRNQDG